MDISTPSGAGAPGNEAKIRLIAFFVFSLVIMYWLTRSVWIPIILVADFTLRSFNKGKISPLAIVSGWLARLLRLPVKPVYMPPKRFAARIGLVFSLVILGLHLLLLNTLIPAVILAFFAALESFAGFCAGCYVYDFFLRFKMEK